MWVNFGTEILQSYELDHIAPAIQELAENGFIADSGRRRWSKKSGRHEIVWVITPLGRKALESVSEDRHVDECCDKDPHHGKDDESGSLITAR
jgi:hypothetical protein